MIGGAPIKDAGSRSNIDTRDPAAARRWAKHLKITREELMGAIEKVGNSVTAVRKQIDLGR